MNLPTRRHFLKSAALVAAAASIPRLAAAAPAPKKILFFTKSSGYQHEVITRKGDPNKLSFAEQLLTDLGAKNNFDITCSKDGRIFAAPSRNQFDAFIFYTLGDLTIPGTDKQPPMSPEDKTAFLESISNGKGFVGIHAAPDTFHSPNWKMGDLNRSTDSLGHDAFDPYIQMLGGEFVAHSKDQQPATLTCIDKTFPAAAALADSTPFLEEWYSLKNFAPDLHVILAQETSGMTGPMYQRKPYPQTWLRNHNQGRVFYTSLGHRPDVWQRPTFQNLLLAALSWTTRQIEVDTTPNLTTATPGANVLS